MVFTPSNLRRDQRLNDKKLYFDPLWRFGHCLAVLNDRIIAAGGICSTEFLIQLSFFSR